MMNNEDILYILIIYNTYVSYPKGVVLTIDRYNYFNIL